MKRIGLGILLMLLAVLVLLQGYFINLQVSWLMMVSCLFLLWLSIRSLMKQSWIAGFFWAGLTGIVVNHQYHFLDISTTVLVTALFLLSAGLRMILPSTKERISHAQKIKAASGGMVSEDGKQIEVNFGSSDKYITEPFDFLETEVNFGTLNLYLGQTEQIGKEVQLKVEVNFASMTIYVPKNWHVTVTADNVFSSISNTQEQEIIDARLMVTGEVNFSSLTIEYV